MSQILNRSPRDALNLKIVTLRFFGFWSVELNTPPHIKLLYHVNYIISIILILSYISSAIADTVININNLSLVIENFTYLITLIVVVVELYTFRTKIDQIVWLAEAIYKPIDHYNKSSDLKVLVIIKDTIFYENLIDKCLMFISVMFDVFLFSPIILNFGALPTRGAFPFDISLPKFYCLAIFIQLGAATMTVITIVFMEAIRLSFIRWINVLLHLLMLTYENSVIGQNITPGISEKLKSPGTSKKIQTCNTGNFTSHQLMLSLKKHYYIVSVVSEMNSTFDLAMMTQICIASIIICLGCFQLVMVDQQDQLRIIFYLAAILCQVFCSCWYASELTAMGNFVRTGIWASGWEKSLTSDVKSIMIMATMLAERKLQISAGKFFIMSLETYITVLRSAYSFLVLLLQMK